jgi:hypothetical protein
MTLHRSELSVDRVRQGETGHGVRFVLGYSLALAIVAIGLAFALAG